MQTLRSHWPSQREKARGTFLACAGGTQPKLHLGCGETYLDGFINIDLPPREHPVMQNVRVDLCANLCQLGFPNCSIGMIRSHHVFEHFDRPTAIALLVEWYQWLKQDGVLLIETPDFERAARRILSGRTSVEHKLAPLRHIFGSHEAAWAYHLDGWFKDKFTLFLPRLGYRDIQVMQFTRGTLDNIIVKARKSKPYITLDAQLTAADELLAYGLVSAQYEQPLLSVWKRQLRKQLGVASS